jgi:hypothetical protein
MRKSWTPREMVILKKIYKDNPVKYTAKTLNRTRNSVHYMAISLGLKRNITCNYPDINPFINISNTSLAYIAGILDGEGCITTFVNPKKNNKFNILIRITNTNMDMLKWVWDILKHGSVYLLKKSPLAFKSNKKAYQWSMNGTYLSLHLLKTLFPYVIIKKKKILSVIKYMEKYEYKKKLRN